MISPILLVLIGTCTPEVNTLFSLSTASFDNLVVCSSDKLPAKLDSSDFFKAPFEV